MQQKNGSAIGAMPPNPRSGANGASFFLCMLLFHRTISATRKGGPKPNGTLNASALRLSCWQRRESAMITCISPYLQTLKKTYSLHVCMWY